MHCLTEAVMHLHNIGKCSHSICPENVMFAATKKNGEAIHVLSCFQSTNAPRNRFGAPEFPYYSTTREEPFEVWEDIVAVAILYIQLHCLTTQSTAFTTALSDASRSRKP